MTLPFRISEAANLAVHATALLATGSNRDGYQPVAKLAAVLGVSESHLAKVVRRLVDAGFLESVRGAHGGFRLARDPGGITLLEVLEAVDGRLPEGGCLLGRSVCSGGCVFSEAASSVRTLLDESLGRLSVKDFASRVTVGGQS